MAGYNIAKAEFSDTYLTDESIKELNNNFLFGNAAHSSSYKYVFLYSLMCSIQDNTNEIIYYDLFGEFAKVYWDLLLNCQLPLASNRKKVLEIEKIITEASVNNGTENYNDLNYDEIYQLNKETSKKCKKYVVGAVYGDYKGLIYSFSNKEERLIINPLFKDYFIRYKNETINEIKTYLSKYISNLCSKNEKKEIFDKTGKMVEEIVMNVLEHQTFSTLLNKKNENKSSDYDELLKHIDNPEVIIKMLNNKQSY